jgi:hypothetical protein
MNKEVNAREEQEEIHLSEDDTEYTTFTDEEIEALQPKAQELKEETDDYKNKKVEEVTLTRDLLLKRKDTPFTLQVPLDKKKVGTVKVRRMMEQDRVNFQKLAALQMKDVKDMTDEEMTMIVNQSYELMASLIVEPKMTVDEWKDTVDLPMLSFLSNKVSVLSYEKDDEKIKRNFRI